MDNGAYRYEQGGDRGANLLTILSLVGGSLGIFIFMVLFDRKSVKENMMSRVFIVSFT